MNSRTARLKAIIRGRRLRFPEIRTRRSSASESSVTRYWLMKCEPDAYTIDDLQRDGRTSWEAAQLSGAQLHARRMQWRRVLFSGRAHTMKRRTPMSTMCQIGWPLARSTLRRRAICRRTP